MTINDNSTKSINAAIIDLQNQIKQLQQKIGILSKNQLKEDDIEFPGKVEYADEAGKAKEADHAKTADTAKYTSETENAVHAGTADNATKATQDASGNVITDTYATKSELTNGLSGKANTSHNHSAADITSGTLTVERGGTGQTTQAGINKAIVGELSEGNDVVTDGTMFVSSLASDNGFADTNAVNVPYKRKFSRVWEYIKGKISSVLGITNNKHIIKGETVDTNTYEDANPKLVFSNIDGSQNASLTFTDYDSVQAPASVTLNGNQGGEYFIAPNIKATGKFYGNLSGKADSANALVHRGRVQSADTFQPLMNNDGKWVIETFGWTGSLYTLYADGSMSGLMFRIVGGNTGPNQVQVNYSIDSNRFGMNWATIINSENIENYLGPLKSRISALESKVQ